MDSNGVEFLGDDGRKAGVRTLAHLELAREHEHGSVGFDLDVRTNRIRQFLWREWHNLRLRSRGERRRPPARCQSVGGSAYRILDARIRSPTTQVAIHPHRDLGGIRSRIRLKQRHCSQRLAWLTVTTLDDVAAIPRVADCVDDRPGGSLDSEYLLPTARSAGVWQDRILPPSIRTVQAAQ
jgi:hypothetical protein